MIIKKEFLTTSQAARLLSVSPDAVLKWVKAGKIKANRTLGGHFRIPLTEIQAFRETKPAISENENKINGSSAYQYCWEYLASGGNIRPECKDCITFKSRATRCYELKDLPGGLGCLNLMCDTECSNCEYFRLVNGQKLNILVVTDNRNIIRDHKNFGELDIIQIDFAADEYAAALKIQEYRPDYIIVDCSMGKKRTGIMCNNLFNDIRIPVVRIVLSSKNKNIEDYCDKEVFGWIRKPFDLEQLMNCIRGVSNQEMK